ncbi:hypothetical protein GF356_12270 [candidate division GN15 bacterium]|nr:hypothetical protein [candidate division GN15 bacterium]
MKKMLTVLVLMMAFMAMTSVVATAHDGCASKTTKTETAEKATKIDKAKAGCTGHTDATHAAHKAECTHHDGVKCASLNLSIEGMVCQSCESVIKATLTEMPGVLAVEKISYKEGKALVCVDPAKVKDAELVKAVTNKGYKAEVMPAVATDATTATATKASAKSSCAKATSACAKICGKAKQASASKDSDKKTGCEEKKSN